MGHDVDARIALHRRGQGSPLIAAAVAGGGELASETLPAEAGAYALTLSTNLRDLAARAAEPRGARRLRERRSLIDHLERRGVQNRGPVRVLNNRRRRPEIRS